MRTAPPVHLAIASSGKRDFFRLKTEKFIDDLSVVPGEHRIFGDDACMSGRKGKPAPDIFVQSLQRLNDALPPGERPIKPIECLVFEDSTAGVEAGRNAGMRVAWVPHPGLLEAYKDHEHLILAGKMDEKGIISEATSDDDSKSYLPFSKDGKVEMMTSLEQILTSITASSSKVKGKSRARSSDGLLLDHLGTSEGTASAYNTFMQALRAF